MTAPLLATDPVLDDPDYRPAFRAALVTILSLVVAALGWGLFARLDSAIMAQGVLFAETERKTIESLEGGILSELLVRPGDRVTAGQVVATLDTTQSREVIAQLQTEAAALRLQVWRLQAEAAGTATLDRALAPVTDPGAMDQPGLADRIAAEVELFAARTGAHRARVEALARQVESLRAQIAAATGQAEAAAAQIALWQEERDQIATLADRGATPRQRLLEVDRTLAALGGVLTEKRNLVTAAERDIARAEAEAVVAADTRSAEIARDLVEARRALETVESRLRAAGDVLDRQSLRAPQDGLIVHIPTVTPGAVVGSGVPLMELVPDGDRLMILARVPPDAVDTVHVGRPATVYLTAFRRAVPPVVDGTVVHVSPDLLTDERDGTTYFEARLAIDPVSLAAQPDVVLVAGMPAQVAIEVGERRAGEYIIEPLLRHMRGAFREE
ncbi:MAG: HlyD family type I secretion periplasmic adaptor subunit [Rhodobacteraceae bacterium]|jgi:HlyD family secretion protein|nr:HlyD family type I secretion periplasmic adaptor subunit [Paracoccaceae bacterium]